MTELLEDLEEQRSKLNKKAEQFRRRRDRLNNTARRWADQRDKLNAASRDKIEKANIHRKERDKLNIYSGKRPELPDLYKAHLCAFHCAIALVLAVLSVVVPDKFTSAKFLSA